MEGKMRVITSIPSKKGRQFIFNKDISDDISAEYSDLKRRNKKDNYTICYINKSHTFIDDNIKGELEMRRVTYLPPLHLLFVKDEDNPEKGKKTE